MSSKRFSVAISFAGEKRGFVDKVAALLAERLAENAVLYDKFHEAELARPRLGDYLSELYQNQTDLVVAILAPDYSKNKWCGLELEPILKLASKKVSNRVMLCRFGHAKPKALYGTAGFLELDHLLPKQMTRLVLDRLELIDGKTSKSDSSPSGVATERPLNLPPNNLPRLHSFFGREKELEVIA